MRTCEKCNRDRNIRAFAKKGRGRRTVCNACVQKPVTDLVRVNHALDRAHKASASPLPNLVDRLTRVMRKEEIARVLVDVVKGTYEVIWFRRETLPLPVQS